MIVLQGARERVEVLSFSPDSRTLAAPCSGGVQLWSDLSEGSRPASVLQRRRVQSLRFAPDGRALLLGGAEVVVHDLRTGQARACPLQLLNPYRTRAALCDLSPDGQSLIATEGDNDRGPPDRVFCHPLAHPENCIWSVSTDRLVHSLPLFLAGGERFVLFEWRDEIETVYATRDARTGNVLSEVEGGRDQFFLPVLSADRRLVAARRGFWAVVFRAEDFGAGPVRVLRNDSRKEFTGLAFHPSGRYLAATSNDATVKLYDTTTWKVARAFDWDIGRLRSVAFSPDGMLAAAGGDSGRIVVWDVDV